MSDLLDAKIGLSSSVADSTEDSRLARALGTPASAIVDGRVPNCADCGT